MRPCIFARAKGVQLRQRLWLTPPAIFGADIRFGIGSLRTGIADQPPTHHVTIAAIGRVAKHALSGVPAQHSKEGWRRYLLKAFGGVAADHLFDDRVLL